MKSIYFETNIPKIVALKALGRRFPSLYYTKLSPVVLDELPDLPLPGPNWVRVSNKLAGICGTDISFFQVKPNPKISVAALPGSDRTFLGHETVGHISEVGPGVKHLKLGDRVTMQPYLPCCSMDEQIAMCGPCRDGNYCLCENYAEIKLPENRGGGFGDHFIAPASQLIKIPDSISDEQAVMIEPAAVSMHAVLRRPPQDGEKVLVLGAGTIGLNVIQFLKFINPNCTVYLMELEKSKQEFGLRMGADAVIQGDPYSEIGRITQAKVYRGQFKNTNMLGGLDAIYDCVGSQKTLHDCLRWLKSRGTYVKIGHHLCPVAYDETPIWQQELNIVGVNSHGREYFEGRHISTFELIIELLRDGRITLDDFITHRFKLDDYRSAFKTIQQRPAEVLKVVLEV